jgi:Tfp pilus assembly protein PilW
MSAGFTLVELMVALTGGLFVSLAVFALARDSGRFYQREARIANATVSALMGFERLRTDIGRAGYLASPNINRDPRVCGAPNASWPVNLRQLASIQISAPAVTYPVLTANGRAPQSLLLAGSYSSPDVFAAQITGTGSTTTVQLEPSQPALLRLGNGANPTAATLGTVFSTGRAVRIVESGRTFYGQVAALPTGGAAPTVTLNSNPAIQLASGSAIGCGLREITSGTALATVNVVNFIHYDIRNLSTDPQTVTGQNTYASLYTSSAAGPGEAQRTELVRVEQDINGLAMASTEEVVAEYAVDFGLQLTAVTAITGCCDPQLGTILPGAGNFNTFAGSSYLSASTPELIRSVRVRLGVRSREGDRANDIASGGGANAGGLFRFNLGTGGAGTTDAYARVRTFQADVALRNQSDILW